MASHEHDADMTPAESLDDKKQKTDHGHGHTHGHGHSHSHDDGHKPAEIVALGTITVGGATFTVDREGQVEAGATTEFGVEHVGGPAATPKAAWLANPDGEKVCEPVAGEDHDGTHWHFNVEPLMPVKKSKFVLQVGEETATLDFAPKAAPCNDGILSVLKEGTERCGFLELKLHGDAGDLELFLYKKNEGKKPKPFDVPKETVMTLTFPNHAGKTVELRVRNMDKNEDEEGVATMRGDGTNYFIFPGETGADPEWLKGEKWRGLVTVAFEVEGKSYGCDPFVLVPHEAL